MYEIAQRISNSTRNVFLLTEFEDIAGNSQVQAILDALETEGKIIKMSEGCYAKAVISPLSNRVVPCKPLRDLATEFLKQLNIDVVPSSYDKDYNEGRTTQVPTGRVIGVSLPVPATLKFGYGGKYVTFEYIALTSEADS